MFADSPAIQSRDDELLLSDGIRLISKLWFPEAGGPWPALLMRQPYGRHIASTLTYAHPSWWAQHGFLVVVQDVRGQGDSTGVFSGFSQEASDTAATHAWVRALPECNGKLGCYGFSYQGLTQLLAPANAQPPDCFAPAMAGLDERDNWSCEGGAHWWHLGLGWGLQLAALQAKRRGDAEAWIKIRRSLENGTYLRDGPALLKEHDPKGMAWTWLQRDPRDREQWPIHPVQTSWLKQPMLLLGGWWDPHLLGLLDLWQQSKAAGGSPKLMVGPATHLEWWPDAQTQLLHFFSQHLKGIDNWPSAKRAQFWNITQSCWQEACTPQRPSASCQHLVTAEFRSCLHRSDSRCSPVRWFRDGHGVDRARSLAPHACDRRASQSECWPCRPGHAGPPHRRSNVQHLAFDNRAPTLRPPSTKRHGSSRPSRI